MRSQTLAWLKARIKVRKVEKRMRARTFHEECTKVIMDIDEKLPVNDELQIRLVVCRLVGQDDELTTDAKVNGLHRQICFE